MQPLPQYAVHRTLNRIISRTFIAQFGLGSYWKTQKNRGKNFWIGSDQHPTPRRICCSELWIESRESLLETILNVCFPSGGKLPLLPVLLCILLLVCPLRRWWKKVVTHHSYNWILFENEVLLFIGSMVYGHCLNNFVLKELRIGASRRRLNTVDDF